jgi:Uri superfamily endonuclease
MLQEALAAAGGDCPPAPRTKKLHWHIDYLLDHETAEIAEVVIVVADGRVEPAMYRLLAAEEATTALAPGLGAGDSPGETHLLRVDAPAAWWSDLPGQLAAVVARSGSGP